MTAIDWIILAVLALCVLQAARRGIFVEAFSLAGIIIGILAADWNYTRYLPWFEQWLRSEALAATASFLAVALAIMLAAGIAGRVIRFSVRSIGLGWADRTLGAAFGLLKGALLVTLGVMLLAAFWPASPALRGSRLGPYFVSAARQSTVGSPAALQQKVEYGAMLLHRRIPTLLNARTGK